MIPDYPCWPVEITSILMRKEGGGGSEKEMCPWKHRLE